MGGGGVRFGLKLQTHGSLLHKVDLQNPWPETLRSPACRDFVFRKDTTLEVCMTTTLDLGFICQSSFLSLSYPTSLST